MLLIEASVNPHSIAAQGMSTWCTHRGRQQTCLLQVQILMCATAVTCLADEEEFGAPQGTQVIDEARHEQGSACAEQQLARGRGAAGVREAVDLAQPRQAAVQASILRRHVTSCPTSCIRRSPHNPQLVRTDSDYSGTTHAEIVIARLHDEPPADAGRLRVVQSQVTAVHDERLCLGLSGCRRLARERLGQLEIRRCHCARHAWVKARPGHDAGSEGTEGACCRALRSWARMTFTSTASIWQWLRCVVHRSYQKCRDKCARALDRYARRRCQNSNLWPCWLQAKASRCATCNLPGRGQCEGVNPAPVRAATSW